MGDKTARFLLTFFLGLDWKFNHQSHRVKTERVLFAHFGVFIPFAYHFRNLRFSRKHLQLQF